MYTRIQALKLRTTAGHARLPRGVGERVHGAQISRGFRTQDAVKKRDNDSPPPQRSWACRACVYSSTNSPTAAEWNISAGQKACAHGNPNPPASAWISRSVAQAEPVEGRIKLCKRGRTEQTVQTFPRGSNELNFDYHVSAWLPMYHKPTPAGDSFSGACTRASDFSRSHARIIIILLLFLQKQNW